MIISASRRTDIPAFFSEWFFNRIKEGYVMVRNPMNYNQVSKIILNPEQIDCIIFWTKNPSQDFIEGLQFLDFLGYNYYIQFTITPYDQTIEKKVPRKKDIIEKFKIISNHVGKEKIIWRYDPILLNEKFDFEYHSKYYEYLANSLYDYTNKCIISFLDFYTKIEKSLFNQNIKQLSRKEMIILADIISKIARKYNLKIESCCEDIDLTQFNITKSHCIDGNLINSITGKNYDYKKDKNQRETCGCISSTDIGVYNTCQHNCIYCYANRTQSVILKNYNPESPLLCSELQTEDIITDRKIIIPKSIQPELFDNL